jgi:8-oxo-dGTP diphosphatase
MDDILATDDDGNQLTAFHPATGPEVSFDDGAVLLALVAVWDDGRLLLAFNRRRQAWELPGGMIDPGETAHRAATRELWEETGLEIDDLVLAGHARILLAPERRVEYAALYTARATPLPAFTPNEEMSAIRWWDGVQPLHGRLQVLDAYLGELTRDLWR